MRNKILIIAAHPDDEVLGCFGTVATLINQGYEAYSLILGEGKSSRAKASKKDFELLEQEAHNANKTIGIKKLFREHFPDNRFDSVDFLDIVKSIEKIKNIIKPQIIFTHYAKDLNIDHQITHKAVLTATRPMKDETVKEIYSFEVLSSTEWNYPTSFSPNVFFDISLSLHKKLAAMKCYKSELCAFPHPRSLKGIKMSANYNGLKVGLKNVEAFELVRFIKEDKSLKYKDFTSLNQDEIKQVLKLRNNKNIAKFMKTQEINLTQHLDFIEKLKNSKDKRYFLLYNLDEILGVIYFTDIKKTSCFFGLYANVALKGVGDILMKEIKTYAFDTLKVKCLKADVLNKNHKALSLYLKNDFTIEKVEDNIIRLKCERGGGIKLLSLNSHLKVAA